MGGSHAAAGRRRAGSGSSPQPTAVTANSTHGRGVVARPRYVNPRMWLLLACAVPPPADVAETAPVDSGDHPADDTGGAEPTLRFRYVVIADPHVYDTESDHLDRLDRAVAWVNNNAEALDLELVLVVGDICWGTGIDAARASLDRLTPTWVPINGDDEIAGGAEEAYALAFADHYEALSTTLDGWVMGPVEVWNPQFETTSWFHNLAFTWKGVRFVGLDWASRDPNVILSEMGELHDFEGGTWPFFVEQVGAAGVAGEDVVMFSHIPMHLSPGGFDLAEMERVTGVTAPRAEHVWADLAGHYHGSASETVPDAGYDLHVTDATWDDEVELRLVEVWANELRFEPSTELVIVE